MWLELKGTIKIGAWLLLNVLLWTKYYNPGSPTGFSWCYFWPAKVDKHVQLVIILTKYRVSPAKCQWWYHSTNLYCCCKQLTTFRCSYVLSFIKSSCSAEPDNQSIQFIPYILQFQWFEKVLKSYFSFSVGTLFPLYSGKQSQI